MKNTLPTPPRRHIVLTRGPGGGKTTAADLFLCEFGERVVVVPETATMLFQGGFPRSVEPHATRCAQTAIFHVQHHPSLFKKINFGLVALKDLLAQINDGMGAKHQSRRAPAKKPRRRASKAG